MGNTIDSELDESDFEDSSFNVVSNPEDYEEHSIARKRAKAVIYEMTNGLPDPDFENEQDNQKGFNEHIERLNRVIRENLDSSSIWEFVFLAGDLRQSITAKMNVQKKLAADPKQAEKTKVRECWELWQKDPSRYKGKAAFGRDMLSKFDSLESQRVIERWCKEWESVPF